METLAICTSSEGVTEGSDINVGTMTCPVDGRKRSAITAKAIMSTQPSAISRSRSYFRNVLHL